MRFEGGFNEISLPIIINGYLYESTPLSPSNLVSSYPRGGVSGDREKFLTVPPNALLMKPKTISWTEE